MLARYPDKNGHTKANALTMKMLPLLQPHTRYRRQWLFTWKIDAEGFPLTFLSCTVFFCFNVLLFIHRMYNGIPGKRQKNWGSSRHGKWLTFYDGFLLMFFSSSRFAQLSNVVWAGFFKNSNFFPLLSWGITREIKCKRLIQFFFSIHHLSTRSFRLNFIIFYKLFASTLML